MQRNVHQISEIAGETHHMLTKVGLVPETFGATGTLATEGIVHPEMSEMRIVDLSDLSTETVNRAVGSTVLVRRPSDGGPVAFVPGVLTVTARGSVGVTYLDVPVIPKALQVSDGVALRLKELRALQHPLAATEALDGGRKADPAGHGSGELLGIVDPNSRFKEHGAHELAANAGGVGLATAQAGLYRFRNNSGSIVELPHPGYIGANGGSLLVLYSDALHRRVTDVVAMEPGQLALGAGIIAVASLTEQKPEDIAGRVVAALSKGATR